MKSQGPILRKNYMQQYTAVFLSWQYNTMLQYFANNIFFLQSVFQTLLEIFLFLRVKSTEEYLLQNTILDLMCDNVVKYVSDLFC